MSFKIVSVNLNKGLATPRRRSLVQRWLIENQPDLFLVQEPWAHSIKTPPDLEGFVPIGGNSCVFAWISETLEPPDVDQAAASVQRLKAGYVALYNVYLSPYSRAERAQELRSLLDVLRTEDDRPALILGDFNLAPEPNDGVVNSLPSHFNCNTDRVPFHILLAEARLIDSTRSSTPEYSIVRRLGNQLSEFRCDLCLISDYYRRWSSVKYDHSTRTGPHPFTDHSALFVDLPLSIEHRAQFTGKLFSWRDVDTHSGTHPSTRGQSSHKTAMARTRESAVARLVVKHLVPRLRPERILDHGCGRGADVEYYARMGLQATGYDPHPTFGYDQRPHHQFDLVVSAFVLNVLPNPWERLKALRDAERFLTSNGRLLVVTRSSAEIRRAAAQAGWQEYNDGFLSSEARDTFQRGVDSWEIGVLAERAGLEAIMSEDDRLPEIQGATQILLKRKSGAARGQ
ncbi:MAG: methyltransferase domain-containing protein [Actinomycetota bacterium]